eukprot:TRINITY_DN1990_c0_g2_i1.p1 TRINITY_DN1990_c0_g2~~TRINITY_DN1990_c0_g2_i1.p1  ORF type:complete len:408 (-),score=70.31 TRINITY_DN1990_c0_g2_i1:99-1322(-)
MSGRDFALCLVFAVESAVGASLLASRAHGSGGEAFMVISGISSPVEMCLASTSSSDLTLQPCASTVAAGDGRDIFSFQANGQLMNVATKQCVGLSKQNVRDGGSFSMMDCDHAAANGDSLFEATEINQLKLVGDGDFCLTQAGVGAGIVDVALHAPATATSTLDFASHGANMAVGQEPSGFWASRIGETSRNVEFSVDFGEAFLLDFAEIRWEFPAKSFSFLVSTDGSEWTEAFATNENVLNVSRIQLNNHRASMAKVSLREPSPFTQAWGPGIYGISSLSVFASQLQTVAQPCVEAAKSSDARDKLFFVHAGEYDPRPAVELRGELPALAAAQTALASIISGVMTAIPKLANCGLRSSSFVNLDLAEAGVFGTSPATSQDGLAIQDAKDLVQAARSLIGFFRDTLL